MRTTVTELIRQEFPAYAVRRKLRIEEHKAAQAMMACRGKRGQSNFSGCFSRRVYGIQRAIH